MRTPRTVGEATMHDLDQPDTARAIRRYSKGSRSANWHGDDIRTLKIVGIGVALGVGIVMWLIGHFN